MRPMQLNFVKQTARGSLAGWLLLAAGGLLLAGVVLWAMVGLQPQLAQREARLAQLEKSAHRHAPGPTISADKQLSDDWTRAMGVAADLNQPWSRLFSALETMQGRQVTLLTLEPDTVKHELALTGEARNFKAMLDYYRRMQAQPIFQSVVLHAHHVNEQDDDRPIRFRITSQWAVSP